MAGNNNRGKGTAPKNAQTTYGGKANVPDSPGLLVGGSSTFTAQGI